MFDMATFARALKVKRAENGMNQAQLAEKAGVNVANISAYETEQQIPRIDNVYRLAEALDCTPNDLIGWGKTA